MQSFQYTITDEIGIHARPAGKLVQMARGLSSIVQIEKNKNCVDATKLMAVLSLGIKCGDTITVLVEGGNEEESVIAVKTFLEENL